MSALADAVADYLTVRRAMGYKLTKAQWLLESFVEFMDDRGAQTVTIGLAVEWARSPAGRHPSWWGVRLAVVRGFATYLQTIDAATEVPPPRLLGSRSTRATPYLYSPGQITALIDAAAALGNPLRALTMRTLIALMAACGMRTAEAVALDRGDFDARRRVLTIRDGKLGKARELPLAASTAQGLREYLAARDTLRAQVATPALFVSTWGTRLQTRNAQEAFREIVACAGLQPRSETCRPRLHDLRHSFAVATMLDAYRDGRDVSRCLALLATYLGHVEPSSTYWYLSASPELMALAGDRLQAWLEDAS